MAPLERVRVGWALGPFGNGNSLCLALLAVCYAAGIQGMGRDPRGRLRLEPKLLGADVPMG